MPLSARFRAVLEARRDALNARLARHHPPRAFLDYLARTVDPLVDASGDAAADSVALALFDLGLLGMPRGIIGEEAASSFERALVAHLPGFGPHWTAAPAALIAALGNGYDRLSRELGEAAARGWIQALAEVAPRCATRELLLDAGLVLAWRLGLAEARGAALSGVARLESGVREKLLGVTELDTSRERRFVAPGSKAPLVAFDVVARVGGFIGFGGPFRIPPRAWAAGDRLVATDGDTIVEIHADVFGARTRHLHWTANELTNVTCGVDAPNLDRAGRVRWAGLERTLPVLRNSTSTAAASGMAAVTLADSHAVFVLGRLEVARS